MTPQQDDGAGIPNLSQKVFSGSVWVFSLRIVQQILSIIKMVVVARMFTPSEYGLVSIALLVLMIMDTFSQTGIQQALLQKTGDIRPFLRPAWTISVIRGVLLAAIAIGISPFAADFFGTGEAEGIIQILALSFLIQGFTNIATVLFQKELDFKKQFNFEFWPFMIDMGVTITLIFMWDSVWAIVTGILAGNVAKLILSYCLHSYRPRLSLDFSKMSGLIHFGKWVMVSTVLLFLLNQGDDLYVAKVIGVGALGLYSMAYNISNIPATQITNVISQVTLPAYCKLQHDLARLKKAYLEVLSVTTIVSFPVAGLLLALGPLAVPYFFGEAWAPMALTMQILVVFGLIRSINATVGPIYLSVGKPKIQTKVVLVQLIAMVALMVPLAGAYGIEGMAISVVLPSAIALVVQTYSLKSVLDIAPKEIVSRLSMTFLATLVSCASMIAIIEILSGDALVEIVVASVVGVAAYASLLYIGHLRGRTHEWQILSMLLLEAKKLWRA